MSFIDLSSGNVRFRLCEFKLVWVWFGFGLGQVKRNQSKIRNMEYYHH